ncbi:MAG: hypothetical protein LBH90_08590 [Tannerella sp.]|jgi:predicted transcriptional regulator|nr:hypothetical protein [Tannerella sp.]
MKTETVYIRFLKEIERHLPKKTKRTNILADILSIGKEAVYRRLRGEVPFTFNEIILLSNRLNISIDNIAGITSEQSRPLQLKISEFIEPFDIDYKMFEEYIDVLESAQAESSMLVEATNMIPQAIYYRYELICKFFYFKWNYHYNQCNKTFEDINLTPRIKKIQNQVMLAAKKIHSTTYIWDPLIIQYLVSDILFCQRMRLICDKNVASIKQELYNLMNYLEHLAQNGMYTETHKKVHIYISSISIDTSYLYLKTPKYNISLIKAFILNGIASYDDLTNEKTKKWIQSLIKTSTLISICGEKQRISFFDKQRKWIDQL